MPIRKASGNMYNIPNLWLWDPLRGKCSHGCSYCYAQKMGAARPAVKAKYSGPVLLDGDESLTNLAKGYKGEDRIIFVCPMNDLFADDVPDWMIKSVLHGCSHWPQFTYMFQTKNPARYAGPLFVWPDKLIRGTTMESNRRHDCMGNAPSPGGRAHYIEQVKGETFVTIEPILQFDIAVFLTMLLEASPDFINIGAATKCKGMNLPEPTGDQVRALIKGIQDLGIEIRQKSNLERLMG